MKLTILLLTLSLVDTAQLCDAIGQYCSSQCRNYKDCYECLFEEYQKLTPEDLDICTPIVKQYFKDLRDDTEGSI